MSGARSASLVGGLSLAAVLGAAGPVTAQEAACPPAESLTEGSDGAMAHIRYLADDALEGRAVGTPGERCAGDYLAARFEALGLEPAGDDGGWFQTWQVRVGARTAGENRLSIEGTDLELGRDWGPLGYSATASLSAPLATVPDTHGQTESHGSLSGRMLVVEEAGDLHRLASEAARMGMGGVISILGPHEAAPELGDERRAALDVPVLWVRDEGGRVMEAAGRGATVSVTTSLEPLQAPARNVAAALPGSPGGETVVVGAHYDHLGRGGEGSLSPNETGTVHNGADDNASGTAVLLEAARALADGPTLQHTVLFLAFSGEERGLWGSAHYVESPLRPLDGTVAMLNLDMVGRVRDGKLTVFGTGTAEEWQDVLERVGGPLELQLVPDGFGSSDHSSFYARGIPVLHFFSGTHPEYHRTGDDWELINAEGLAQVTDLVSGVVETLSSPARPVALTPVEGAGNPHGAPGEAAGDGESVRSGFNVRLGTIPDYSQESGGMRITGVRDDSPAARAGLQSGDVIVRMGDRTIDDVYSYMYALQAHEPGDVVEVEVLRDGSRRTFTVTLEAG